MAPADALAVEAFNRSVEQWHDYYLLAGTAAATLMGLLFVSLSIHLEKVVDESGAHLEAAAREAFASFLIVLALSLMTLSPTHRTRPLGASLVFLGVFRAALTANRIRKMLSGRGGAPAGERGGRLLRFAFPFAASGFMAWAGIALLRRNAEDGLVGVMLSSLLLIADATRTAYELLVRTARVHRRAGRG